jgi:hypothetical protein
MSGARYAQISKGDDIDRIIAAAAGFGLVGRVELLRSVRRCELNLIEVDRQGHPPNRLLKASARPVIAVIGDDDYASTGPAGWAATLRLICWAKASMIHGTGADAPSYRAAIAMALVCRRFLLIETDSGHLDEWGATLRKHRVPFLGLRPPNGSHPVALDRGEMQ